ncbi:hypothetical protein L211DRAFT_833515 [Terfezia boudieri ATCC MYA-4762]|uniref:Uncharacterized protein n=1 Tax=Terfezia boudieri ATCC MYA-4762 TaxID=1051890 RepID=A0A3N4M059_9PEZI|nr:hypothetical protein L211DRAFT_833515 [Terfezia boudieri ATCC MYA-4762]
MNPSQHKTPSRHKPSPSLPSRRQLSLPNPALLGAAVGPVVVLTYLINMAVGRNVTVNARSTQTTLYHCEFQ